MKKRTTLSLLACTAISFNVSANSIEGKVTNTKGEPVANAQIEIHSTGKKTVTDSEGRFVFVQIDQGNTELHIRASGFAHLHQDVMV